MNDQKDTIYVDIDDEITSMIDKVVSSKKKVVALVLPKRATVMQSIVNMRLLKRASEEAGKSIVLITSEASVMPLAGAVGVYVAKTLQSKPIIPIEGQDMNGDEPDIGIEDADETELDETKSVGELAGEPEEDSIEVDNDGDSVPGESIDAVVKPEKVKKDRKLKIPNFDSFRKKLFIGLGLLLLFGFGWYYAFYVMPSAKITLKTDTTTTAVDLTFTANPAAKELDEANKIVPATVRESKKTNSQKTATTGEKNLGDKAGGKMTMKLTTDCVSPLTDVPSGTTVSSDNLNFITQKKAKFSPPPTPEGGKCVFSSNDVDVIAASGGGSYNLSARTYTVAGFPAVTGSGENMSGGSDKIIKIVSQQDLDTAKTKALEGGTDSIKAEIVSELQKDGYIAVPETFAAGSPVVSSSPNVGDEANEVTVNVVTSYTVLGIEKESLKKLVESEAKKQIDISKQTISDDGLSTANYQLFDRKPNGETRLNLKTNIVTGAQLNAEDLKKQIAGKKRGEIQQILNIPGVKDLDIKFSPFWVNKVPKNPNKITITFEQNGGK